MKYLVRSDITFDMYYKTNDPIEALLVAASSLSPACVECKRDLPECDRAIFISPSIDPKDQTTYIAVVCRGCASVMAARITDNLPRSN